MKQKFLLILCLKYLILLNVLIQCKIFKRQTGCDITKDYLRLPTDCSKYYRCVNNQLTILSCPTGYFYDQTSRLCRVSNLVSCTPTSTVSPSLTCPSPLEKTPVAGTSCSQFYLCVNSVLNKYSCPTGMAYDVNIKMCNYANKVVCSDAPVLASTTAPPLLNCNNVLDKTLVPGTGCKQFFACINNGPLILSCPSDLLFDLTIKMCNLPSKVTCPDSTLAPTTTTTQPMTSTSTTQTSSTTTSTGTTSTTTTGTTTFSLTDWCSFLYQYTQQCENGGTCINDPVLQYKCKCPATYSGRFCENKI